MKKVTYGCAVLTSTLLAAFGQGAADIPSPSFSDVRYGADERQVMDVWVPQGVRKTPAPCILFIHGGGWLNGDKSDVFKKEKYLKPLLDSGFAVVSINYRFISKHPFPAPMLDAARALQFLRSKSSEWNIHKQRIGVTGTSAGGCSSLWLAFHDDMAKVGSDDPVERESTRVACVYALNAQSTLDPKELAAWTGNDLVFQHHMLKGSFGPGGKAGAEVVQAYSPVAQLTADDPPVLFNVHSKEEGPPESIQHAIHHPGFAIGLQQRALEVKVHFERAKKTDDYLAFYKRHLME